MLILAVTLLVLFGVLLPRYELGLRFTRRVGGPALLKAAAVIGAATLVAYGLMLSAEHETGSVAVIVITSAVVAGCMAAALGAFFAPARPALAAVAAACFTIVGVLGIFSIGLPLLLAAVCSMAAAGDSLSTESRAPKA